MLKDIILQKGLMKVPVELEDEVMMYAASQIEVENSDEWLEYANWVPLLGVFIMLRDLLRGYRYSILPGLRL